MKNNFVTENEGFKIFNILVINTKEVKQNLNYLKCKNKFN